MADDAQESVTVTVAMSEDPSIPLTVSRFTPKEAPPVVRSDRVGAVPCGELTSAVQAWLDDLPTGYVAKDVNKVYAVRGTRESFVAKRSNMVKAQELAADLIGRLGEARRRAAAFLEAAERLS